MKKLFIVLSVAVMMAALVTSGVNAQECKKHGEMKMQCHGEQAGKGECCPMMKELNLTEAQQAEITKIKQACMEGKKELHAKMMELHQKKCALMKAEKPEKEAVDKITAECDKIGAEMKKACADCQAKVAALLNPEQLKKMQEMKAKCAKDEGKGCCKAKAEGCCKGKAEGCAKAKAEGCCKGKAEGCAKAEGCCKAKAEGGCKGHAKEAKAEASKCSQSATCASAKKSCS